MTVSPPSVRDPRVLAESVRELATRAYDALREPSADDQERRELSRRITELQSRIDGLTSDDLSVWLENLRRQVESAGASRPAAARLQSRSVAPLSAPPGMRADTLLQS